jgi:hypothetical protein
MANKIQVSLSQSIVTLYKQGLKKLRIARELGVDTKTVRRHIALYQANSLLLPPGVSSNSLIPPPGELFPPDPAPSSNSPLLHAGELLSLPPAQAPNSLLLPPGSAGRESQCVPHQKRIEEALAAGLSAQRIYQDLITEEAFKGSYDAVKRYVRQRRGSDPQRFHRFESPPGEEAQIDFGRGAPIRNADGRMQKT